MLQQINAEVVNFKADHKAQLSDLQSQIADVAAKSAARGLGQSGGNFEPMDGNQREISAALRSFIRSDDHEALASIMAPNAAMSVGSDPDGGYSVYPTLGGAMNKRVYEVSPMRQLARVVTASSSSFEEFNDLDEAEAGWVGETEIRPETGTPKLGVLSVPVHEMYAMPKITQKLLDDSELDLASWLVEKCAMRFARKEGAAFIGGDGILKPRGLLSYTTAATPDATRAWGTIEHINTGTSGGFGAAGGDVLIDFAYSLKTVYRPNASWLMNRKTAATVRKMKDGDGNFIWAQSLASGEPDRLLGFPVVLDEEMPDIGANSLSIAFGDFREGYIIVDRHGLRLLRDPFTSKPNVLFYAYKRVGGSVANFEAVKLLRFGTA
ncbi:phage major capsid protein [Roseovarius sp. MBR-51]